MTVVVPYISAEYMRLQASAAVLNVHAVADPTLLQMFGDWLKPWRAWEISTAKSLHVLQQSLSNAFGDVCV